MIIIIGGWKLVDEAVKVCCSALYIYGRALRPGISEKKNEEEDFYILHFKIKVKRSHFQY